MSPVQFKDATAFITGGAQGIGLGIATALAKRGVKLALADIDEQALAEASDALSPLTSVRTYVLDVRDREGFARIADDAEAALGPVTLLFNNAGVAGGGRVDRMSYDNWDWLLGINIGGVVNGIQTFLPRWFERDNGGYLVNTASGAGLVGAGSGHLYVMSKFAVVGLSESLHIELKPKGIGVSVLCPGPVATKIMTNSRKQQQNGDGLAPVEVSAKATEGTEAMLAMGTSPEDVGEMVIVAMEEDRLYIHTDDLMLEPVKGRAEWILSAMPSVRAAAAAEPTQVVAAPASAFTGASGSAVDGSYEIAIEAPQGANVMTLNLVTTGGVLAGTVTDEDRVIPIANAAVAGSTATFEVSITQPLPMTLKFEATVDGDVISGSAKAGSVLTLPFEGKRI